jgi:tRNA dimethylallyltransferase
MNVVLIAGPTASGKSSAAIGIAEKHNGVIINADSMQVYAQLDVLTSRPSRQDEARVEHRLYGYLSPGIRGSVAQWIGDAGQAIHAVLQAGKRPVVVGGTGLYFKALEFGLAAVPEIPEKLRSSLRDTLQAEGVGSLYRELLELDCEGARRLKENDSQRILRALEVIKATGKPLSYFHQRGQENSVLAGLSVKRLALAPPREKLYQRINERFGEMVEAGALEEVKRLRALNLAEDLPAMKAIGVRSLGQYLDGKCSLEEAMNVARQETRNYAKRQMTWQRNQMAHWSVFEQSPDIGV